MKIILFKLWTNYTERDQRTIFPQWEFIWTTHFKVCTLYVHHRVCIGESIREIAENALL